MTKRTTDRTWTDEDVAEYVRRSTAEQGLPEKITDPGVLHRIATIMRDHGGRRQSA